MRAIAPFCLAALALLAACGKAPAEEDAAVEEVESVAPAAPAAPPSPPPAKAVSVKEANELYEFDYAYPAEAAAIPALKALLDADLAEARAKIATQAREGRDMAKEEGFPFNPWSSTHDWRLVTAIPGWVSLSALVGEYTGGAHPNYWFDAVLWDEAAGRRRAATDLFVSKEALSKAIRPAFCHQINTQRAKKRGEPVDPASDYTYDLCLDPVDYVVILGSSDRQAFNRIGVLVPPYEAGPYAEGDYEATVPVTRAVLEAVKPEYRRFFAIGS